MRYSFTIAATLVTLGFGCGPTTPAVAEDVVVNVPQAEVKAEDRVLGQVREGTRLSVKRRSGSWLLVTIPDTQQQGWISERDVRLAAAAATEDIEGWGTAINPEGDCTIREQSGKLTIRVPAGVYDLWYGEEDPAHRSHSPRVVRTVRGDFVAQVRVTADWSVGTPLASGRFSRVAGLLIWDSEDHYLRHERNLFQSMRQPGVTAYWTPPLYDRGGARISTWKAGNTDIFGGRSTWLRLERKGQSITASMSRDGRVWEQTAVLETTFPETVSVGVLAHQASGGEFACEFDEFRLEAPRGRLGRRRAFKN